LQSLLPTPKTTHHEVGSRVGIQEDDFGEMAVSSESILSQGWVYCKEIASLRLGGERRGQALATQHSSEPLRSDHRGRGVCLKEETTVETSKGELSNMIWDSWKLPLLPFREISLIKKKEKGVKYIDSPE